MTEQVAPEFYIDSEQPHLGGYIVGGDSATYYPKLWDWLVKVYGIRSVLDIGCGEGHAIDYFARLLCDGVEDDRCPIVGIDGVEQDSPHIFQHDFTKSEAPMYDFTSLNTFDLVWSCEFVEHVDERYVSNFLDTFSYGRLTLMTHAEPGQPGHHHVNCQTSDYWKGAMAAAGFSFDKALTRWTRSLAAMNPSPHNHFARSGLAFVRFS